VAGDVVWMESQPVEETAVEKERKVFVGSWKTPWWPDLKQERPPCGGHQMYVCISVHRGCRGVVCGNWPEVRECYLNLLPRGWLTVVCLLAEGRDALGEAVYANANKTLVGQFGLWRGSLSRFG